ncbi:MAG: DMT family protein [Phycisphaeraceae bacterium]
MIKWYPILLLIGSNCFMTYAWYGHLKDLRYKPLCIVILASWGVAFFEYCLQVPANRLGHQTYTLAQLKVMQEVITMSVFALFCVIYMKEKLTWDYLWGGLCLVGAAYFMFRGGLPVQH